LSFVKPEVAVAASVTATKAIRKAAR
jgi:hypothetical protein